MRFGRALFVVVSAAALARLVVAGVIDLDPPLEPSLDAALDAARDAALDAGTMDSGSPSFDAAGDARPDSAAGSCLQDSDCRSEPGAGVACVDTRCVAGRCTYALCPTGKACSVKACDVEAGAGTCLAEQEISFTAGEFTFATDTSIATLPCATANGTNLSRCFAAAYPFVFAAHTLSSPATTFAFAYSVADVTATSPQPIAVEGVDFIPAIVLQSGDFVFFVGKVQAVVGSNRIPIAWLEVPRDPRATSMKATKVELTYGAPAGIAPGAFRAPNGGVFITSGGNAALIRPPIVAGTLLAPSPPAVGTANLPPVAASGDRLILVSASSTGTVTAQIIRNAATGGAIVTPSTPADVTAEVGRAAAGQSTFAFTPEGTVMSSVARFDGGSPAAFDAVRVAWLIEPSLGFSRSADAGVTIATYPFVSARVTGPIAAVDPGRAVALALALPSSGTVAQLVERDDAGVLTAPPTRREIYDGGPATFSSATSAGWVYLFQATDTSVTVRILQPSCDVKTP